MVNIKKFIDRISLLEGRGGRDVVIPITEARQMRDELAKLLADLHELQNARPPAAPQPDMRVEIVGGKW